MTAEFKDDLCAQLTMVEPNHESHGSLNRRSLLLKGATLTASLAVMPVTLAQSSLTDSARPSFKRIPVQYIAALADPQASSGDNAQQWGHWRLDPGPRGVRLYNYENLVNNNNIAPSQWKFDNNDWWLEENGLIMEPPEFPMPAGKYLVTGDREKQSMLTIEPIGADGNQHWQLDNNANVYDVTHLRCRSARYTSSSTTEIKSEINSELNSELNSADSCTPANAKSSDFPVTPGAVMPTVEGCNQQDYAVLFIYAIAEPESELF